MIGARHGCGQARPGTAEHAPRICVLGHMTNDRAEPGGLPMRVDIWSDIVCPWCYIGQRRFARGLAGFEHRDEVEVVYRSFELDPSTPKGQVTPVLDLLAAQYGMSRAQAGTG